MSFVHLRMHTGYSMKDGIIKIDQALEKAKDDNMPALAITDLNNVMAAINFYEQARKIGVKPILGVDVSIENTEQDDENSMNKLTFLVKSENGYKNVNKLLSRAYIENKRDDTPIIKREWLEEMDTSDFIVLSGATEGRIGQLILKNKIEEAEQEALWMKGIFENDNFYIELQRDGHKGQESYLKSAVNLASKNGLPVVATHMNQFLNEEDYHAHDTRVVIAEGSKLEDPSRIKKFTTEQYFKNTAEMEDLFKDIPAALENTVEIAKRCNFTMNLGKVFMPHFPLEDGQTEEGLLRELSNKGMERRLALSFEDQKVREEKRKEYQARLDEELTVIENMGFAGYFLIVQDFINWAKDNDIPVGPGRGSGAGSLVAYSLRITDVDPLPYDLLFERFLNPDRVSMPDFDVDFCRERRNEVVNYVRKKYGANNVAQIATAGAMESKAVVKDVARVMGVPPFIAQELTNLIPREQGVPISLERAITEISKLREKYENEPDMKKLFDLAIKLEGTPRQFGMHAAGVLIAPSEITDFTPLYYDGKGVTSHFDMKYIEKAGLIKFDFLGLDTLTVINKAIKLIKDIPGYEDFNIDNIPLNDENAYNIYREGDTAAVFQSESDGMRKMMSNLKPSNIEDVIACMALYRPGPLGSGMVNDFISRKHGESVIEYPHPDLEAILKPTYGVILYQEQVMKIARELASYSLGEADLLRRAMGKKSPEEMEKQRSVFTQGAVKNGVNKETAIKIFKLMEYFAEYGFNKSHSAAYGLLSYQTAYLKAHFPEQLYAAAMTCKAGDGKFDKVAYLVEDARNNGFEVLPPDVNKSGVNFMPEGKNQIRFGFNGIKGVGESAALAITKEKSKGDYEGFFEFGLRVGKGAVNKRVKEALINSGSLDSFGFSREDLVENLDSLQSLMDEQEKAKNGENGQPKSVFNEMLGEKGGDKGNTQNIKVQLPEMKVAQEKWSDLERLGREQKTFEFYFSGHPYDVYKEEFYGLKGVSKLSNISPNITHPIYAAGIVTSAYERKAKVSGNPWCVFTISDGKKDLEVVMFGEDYQSFKNKIKENEFLLVGGRPKENTYQGGVQLTGNVVLSKNETRSLTSEYVKIAIDGNDKEIEKRVLEVLDSIPKSESNFNINSGVIIYKKQDNARPLRTNLGSEYQIQITDTVLEEIREIVGKDYVKTEPRKEVILPPIGNKRSAIKNLSSFSTKQKPLKVNSQTSLLN